MKENQSDLQNDKRWIENLERAIQEKNIVVCGKFRQEHLGDDVVKLFVEKFELTTGMNPEEITPIGKRHGEHLLVLIRLYKKCLKTQNF